MNKHSTSEPIDRQDRPSRRRFLGGALTAAAGAPLLGPLVGMAAEKTAPQRKLKVGLIGCGGRGSWIAKLFLQHGGYEFHAVADYFQPVSDQAGDALGVDPKRRFSGLSGYRKVIESGVEAVVLKALPCFFAEHARAAVDAGLHVYMAKPVAVDVPGCLQIQALGKQATAKQRVFLVDYQMPTDPANQEVAAYVHGEEFGPLARIATVGVCGGHPDPVKTETIESRLQNNIWDNDIALGGDFINVFDIHAIDAAIWLLGRRPVVAMGGSRICRPEPHGDSRDVLSVVFEYADGLVHEHFGQALPNRTKGELSCKAYSFGAHAVINYWGDSSYEKRGKPAVSRPVEDLYPAGANRNIAAFYQAVTVGQCENATVTRAVDGCLTAILGREAAGRHGRLTMDELLRENRRIEADLTGLKA